ncbi:MAG: helix-turn-helix domain-containing protein [Cumulibacter sp.]
MAAVTDPLEGLGSFIRAQREQAKVSLRQLAELTEVSNPYLSQIERGVRRPSAEILAQIAKGLRISAESLYVRAGLLDPAVDPAGVEEAIRGDSHLTVRQQQALIEIYLAFRSANRTDNDAD